MNVKLLRKIAKVIQEKPRQFDMNFWHYGKPKAIPTWLPEEDRGGYNSAEGRLSAIAAPKSCGTTHCIAGWAQLLSRSASQRSLAFNAGRKALRLTPKQARRLFQCEWWPDGFGGYDATPKQAAARIEHFIKTKGAE